MSFSRETNEKIYQFAKEQSQYYLDAAEMTYMEKLRRKTGQTGQKISKKLARFKSSSNQAVEAQNDLILYMNDYMDDLMAKGTSEQEAFEKAKTELEASGNSGIQTGLQERFREYYENRDLSDYEAIGLFYGGFVTIGLVAGALIGYVASGGWHEFLGGGWIDTVIGAGVGILLGAGFGQISNAIIVSIKKRQR